MRNLPALFLLLLTASLFAQPDLRPNVVLIVADDLGWKDLGCMGSTYYETPRLDALAAQGLRFTRAYAAAANCAPSRACMLSGVQSPRHGVYTVSPSSRGKAETRKLVPIPNVKHLGDDVFTLADMFRSAGYRTANFGKWHVGNDPTRQGIDHNVGGSGRGYPGPNGYFSPYNIDFIEDGPEGEYLTDRLTIEAIDFLEKNRENPFFLYFPYYTVHTPLLAKPELEARFADKPGGNGQDNPTYAAMVYSLDENVGRVLDALDRLELAENTLVIFTSDNGGIRDVSRQEPLRAGKGSYYEGGIRVPLLIRWPGYVEAGSQSDARVTNLDFFPTLRTVIDAKPPKGKVLDGQDLSPLWNGKNLKRRDLVWHFPVYLQAYSREEDDGRDPLFRTRPGTALIRGDWKLHEYFEDGGLELYDLAADPGERNNLAATHPKMTRRLHRRMQRWRKRLNAPVPTELNPEYTAGR